MFTVTLKQLMDSEKVLLKILERPLPTKVCYSLTKIKDCIVKEAPFYRDSIRKIVFDCAQLDEKGELIPTDDGNGFKLKDDKIIEFHERMEELEKLPIEIPTYQIPLERLDNLEFSIAEMTIMMPFIKEE